MFIVKKDVFNKVVLSNAADSSTVCSCCEQHAMSEFVPSKQLRIAHAVNIGFARDIADGIKEHRFHSTVAAIADAISCNNKHEEDFVDETEVASYLLELMQFAYLTRREAEMLERESA